MGHIDVPAEVLPFSLKSAPGFSLERVFLLGVSEVISLPPLFHLLKVFKQFVTRPQTWSVSEVHAGKWNDLIRVLYLHPAMADGGSIGYLNLFY